MMRGSRWMRLYLMGGIAFLYVPLGTIAVMSLNRGRSATLPVRGFTLDWYRELTVDERFAETSWFSLRVATGSTLIAAVMATAGAFATSRSRGRWTRAAAALYVAPLFMPTLVLAVAMASTFRLMNVRLSFWTVTAGHVVVDAPLVYLIVFARLRDFDWTLVQAARSLGAVPRQALMRVVVPLVAPAVVGGSILAFAVSLDNFVVSLFLTGGESTLPLLVWSLMREGFRPSINAVATLFLATTLSMAITAQWLIRVRR